MPTRADWTPADALSQAINVAGYECANGHPDNLLVLAIACPEIPGEQTDSDGTRAVPAIDVLRHVVNTYEQIAVEKIPVVID